MYYNKYLSGVFDSFAIATELQMEEWYDDPRELAYGFTSRKKAVSYKKVPSSTLLDLVKAYITKNPEESIALRFILLLRGDSFLQKRSDYLNLWETLLKEDPSLSKVTDNQGNTLLMAICGKMINVNISSDIVLLITSILLKNGAVADQIKIIPSTAPAMQDYERAACLDGETVLHCIIRELKQIYDTNKHSFDVDQGTSFESLESLRDLFVLLFNFSSKNTKANVLHFVKNYTTDNNFLATGSISSNKALSDLLISYVDETSLHSDPIFKMLAFSYSSGANATNKSLLKADGNGDIRKRIASFAFDDDSSGMLVKAKLRLSSLT